MDPYFPTCIIDMANKSPSHQTAITNQQIFPSLLVGRPVRPICGVTMSQQSQLLLFMELTDELGNEMHTKYASVSVRSESSELSEVMEIKQTLWGWVREHVEQ